MKQLTLLFFLLLALMANAQTPICHIDEYTIEDGLPQDIVTEVIQDKKGFMWVATRGGLNKFDGYTFKNFKASANKESTLSSNRITHIVETAYGDIWCQTYDKRAYIFDTYTEEFYDVLRPLEEEIKRNNQVASIYSLPGGIAWLVCDKGYCYRVDEKKYKESDGIELYSTFSENLKGENVYTIFKDSQGDEWILTDKGVTVVGQKKVDSDFPFKSIGEYNGVVYLVSTSENLAYYDEQTKSVRFIEAPFDIGRVGFLVVLKSGYIALASNKGIVLYDPKSKSFRLIDIRTATQPLSQAIALFEDSHGEIWVYSNGKGVVRVNLETNEKQHLYTPEHEVVKYERNNRRLLFETNEGVLWVIPHDGNLSYYDREKKQLKHYYTDPGNPKSLFAPLVRFCFKDRQGNAWLVSARGIKKMSFFPQNYTLKQLEDGFEVRALYRDESQRLWVASKSGYIRIYNPDGTLLGYFDSRGNITKEKVQFPSLIYCFAQSEGGNIWMGTKTAGLVRLGKRTDMKYTIEYFQYDSESPYSISSNDIYTIFTDSKHNVWVGTYGGGINMLKESLDGDVQFISHRNKLKNFPMNQFNNIRYITEAEDGVMMLGTTFGLLTFSNNFDYPEEIKFYKNVPKSDERESLVGSDVMHIYMNSKKEIFVLSFTGGINKILTNNLLSESITFKNYSIHEGLHSDLVLSMLEDEDGGLWVATENSLSKFDSETELFDNYDTRFLRQKMNITEAIPTVNAAGQLVFGTDMGVLEFYPEEMRKNEYVPPVMLTDLRINSVPYATSVDNLEEVKLRKSGRNFTVIFAALDFLRPYNLNYAYQLEGLEDDWNYSDRNRQARYINLPPGQYKLKVKSTNSDGVWVDNTRTLLVNVVPTFWETPWAWLIYTVSFILFTLIIIYVFFYIYRLRNQVDMEQQLSNIKLKFFTDISHELRTPLTLISTPLTEVLESEKLSSTAREHLTVVRKNTERMLRLVNQILDFRKIQNKKMKLMIEETELVAFLMKITESFSSVAEENQMQFSLQANQEELFVWLDRDKVEKMIFNLLSNAFKYTLPGKSVTVKVEKKEKEVVVSVIDEGIGIAPEKLESLFKRFETVSKYNMLQPSSGIGLSLVKELVDMHHGNIEVKSQLGKGSCFSITLPLDKSVYEDDEQAELILTDVMQSEPDAEEVIVPVVDTEINDDERPTILVVEDNQELRNLLRTILSRNYTVLQAVNGEEGLKLAAKTIPDMIISDVMMPVMDGLEMIKKIKENNDIRHIPIVLLSAKSSLDDRILALEQGVDDYITKPFSTTYLKTKVAALFAQRKQLQEIFVDRLSAKTETNGAKDWNPSKPEVMPHDEQFMNQVIEFLEANMDNPDLIIDDFADKMMLSRTVFYRKLKSIVGMAPVDFIREIRIKRAAQLIESNVYNFSQIAYMTGFNDPKYFGKCFKKHIGMTPSEYKNSFGTPEE
ncbi:hybrid sensor histidine kinase/response regulator [Bacteroides sp. 214]|uniref:hybrid sensor histidine kinase/response regulator transcription factor n=1 Tax=Bacteroides sp. 214 TaxID=2302935 RepID=UPI0013D62E7B|nr:hybrid sensor histidine kinase/response regulator transcription factor [Bacteroides sp. 214]NDW13433.1 hybrid sensor histidine kinase/response regulator [Bacteroides sp. 214]